VLYQLNLVSISSVYACGAKSMSLPVLHQFGLLLKIKVNGTESLYWAAAQYTLISAENAVKPQPNN